MGRYSLVNVSSLSSAVKNAISELGRNGVSNVKSNMCNRNVWNSQCSSMIEDKLDDIQNSRSINGSIYNLKNRLNKLESACSYIKSCQKIEDEIDELRSRLYKDDGSINRSIQNRINSKSRTLATYEATVDNLLKG